MSAPLLDPVKTDLADGPVLFAVELSGDAARVTGSHRHARGQIFGAVRGLLSVGTDDSQWVVPAIHAVWLPPNLTHSVRSHGAFAGWSVYVSEKTCADLPNEPCTIRTSGLLREAVSRAATWHDETLSAAQMRVAGVILDEIRSSPREAFGLPMPRDVRVLRIARALADDLADNQPAGGVGRLGRRGDANLDPTVYRRDRVQLFRMAPTRASDAGVGNACIRRGCHDHCARPWLRKRQRVHSNVSQDLWRDADPIFRLTCGAYGSPLARCQQKPDCAGILAVDIATHVGPQACTPSHPLILR